MYFQVATETAMSRGEAAIEEYLKLRRAEEQRRAEELRHAEELRREIDESQVYWAQSSKNSTMRELLLLFEESRATRIAEACKVKDEEVFEKWRLSLSSLTFVPQSNVKEGYNLSQFVSTTTSHAVVPVVALSLPATLSVATSHFEMLTLHIL